MTTGFHTNRSVSPAEIAPAECEQPQRLAGLLGIERRAGTEHKAAAGCGGAELAAEGAGKMTAPGRQCTAMAA